jgi:hypothetical protein
MAGLWDSLGSLTGGLIGGSSSKDPYKKAMKQYEKYGEKASGYQNPFYNAGTGAIPDYQNYLNNMKDPSKFINDLMGGYEESPYSKYLQDQSMRAAQNMGSANGLSGSTPLTQFAQENSSNLSSADMDKWLQNVLGINNQYGGGLEKLLGMGQNSANTLTSLYENMGNQMGGAAAGSQNYKNKQLNDILSGIFGIGSSFDMSSMMNSSGGSGGGNGGGGGGGNSSNQAAMMMKLLPLLMG